jgi:cytochrome c553
MIGGKRALANLVMGWTLIAVPGIAADFPDWAYPANPPVAPFDAVVLKQMPGSTKQFTQAQIENDFSPPDWFPQDHPPMPKVVANGMQPAVKACSKCHVSNGAGHPESSDLAGLTADYIKTQVLEFKNGTRKGKRATSMFPIAKAVSDADLQAAADYYAALKPVVGWLKVEEKDTVPRTHLATGAMRFATTEGGTELLGDRIIEVPQNPERADMRDSRTGFIAYVPPGSVAKGEKLVTKGVDGKVAPCGTCHGDNLAGKDQAPRIAGRDPMYVFRQLNDIKTGTRAGPTSELMQQVVANLNQDDMLVIAAYLATRRP